MPLLNLPKRFTQLTYCPDQADKRWECPITRNGKLSYASSKILAHLFVANPKPDCSKLPPVMLCVY